MLDKCYNNHDWLYNQYINKVKTIEQISVECDVSYNTIDRSLRKNNVVIRNRTESRLIRKYGRLPKNGYKFCYKCMKEYKLEKDQLCKECRSNRQKIYYNKYNKYNEQEIINKILMKKYKIGYNDFMLLLKKQDNKCKICSITVQRDTKRGGDKACIDHDHKTGIVRGILCQSCNGGLGFFKDRIENLQNAVCYLKESTNQ